MYTLFLISIPKREITTEKYSEFTPQDNFKRKRILTEGVFT